MVWGLAAIVSNATVNEPWVDESFGRWQFTTTDTTATTLKAVVGACLALSGRYILKIILSFLHGALLRKEWQQGEPLISRDFSSPARQRYEAIRNVAPADGTASGRVAARKNLKHFMEGTGKHTGAIMSGLAVLWVVGAAFIVMATFAGRDIAAGHAALWHTRECGLFEYDEHGGLGDGTVADLHDRERESRAGEYAKSCYESRLSGPSLQCDFYYRKVIDSEETREFGCPFENTHGCVSGADARSIVFTTRVGRKDKDVSYLGLNSKRDYEFRRVTQCMPLSMEYPFVRNTTDENGITTFWYRHLQPIDNSSDWAYWTTGDPFDWHAPGYSVRIFTTSSDLSDEAYRPWEGLEPPKDSRFTVIYISAMHIWYQGPSKDPVFPADEAHSFQDRDWYRKSDPRARALGCIDQTFLCNGGGQDCKSITEQFGKDKEKQADFWMMKKSLNQSDAFNAMILRQGNALVAQELLSIYNSPRLESQHWAKEARRIFHTSLAWAQFAAWGIANGEGKQFMAEDGYSDFTPKDLEGDLCKLYKFEASGVINIQLWPLILWGLVWPVTYLLSLDITTVRKTVNWLSSMTRNVLLKFTTSNPVTRLGTTDRSDAQVTRRDNDPESVRDQELETAGQPDFDTTVAQIESTDEESPIESVIRNEQERNTRELQSTVTDVSDDDSDSEIADTWQPLVIHWLLLMLLWYVPFTIFWASTWLFWDVALIGLYRCFGRWGTWEPRKESPRYDNFEICLGEGMEWLSVT